MAADTRRFPAAFMRHDVAELARFPDEGALWLDVELIKRLSPTTTAVMELKTPMDLQWMAKVSRWPIFGVADLAVCALSLRTGVRSDLQT